MLKDSLGRKASLMATHDPLCSIHCEENPASAILLRCILSFSELLGKRFDEALNQQPKIPLHLHHLAPQHAHCCKPLGARATSVSRTAGDDDAATAANDLIECSASMDPCKLANHQARASTKNPRILSNLLLQPKAL